MIGLPFDLDEKTFFLLKMKDRSLDRFNNLIKVRLGQHLEFAAELEASNGSVHAVVVESKDATQLDAGGLQVYNDWLQGSGGGYGIVPIVMNHMCHLGYIPAGDYLIYFSW